MSASYFWFYWLVNDRIDPRYWNRYVKPGIAAAGKDKWKNVGAELIDKSTTELGIIETDNPGDIASCVSKMFTKWQQQKRGTWKDLLSALRKADLRVLADEIKGRLQNSEAVNDKKKMTPKSMWKYMLVFMLYQ